MKFRVFFFWYSLAEGEFIDLAEGEFIE
ncbi:unnamed protein product [Bathycoccus prasinos]